MSLVATVKMVNLGYYGSFSVGMLCGAHFMFGEDSPMMMSYWKSSNITGAGADRAQASTHRMAQQAHVSATPLDHHAVADTHAAAQLIAVRIHKLKKTSKFKALQVPDLSRGHHLVARIEAKFHVASRADDIADGKVVQRRALADVALVDLRLADRMRGPVYDDRLTLGGD